MLEQATLGLDAPQRPKKQQPRSGRSPTTAPAQCRRPNFSPSFGKIVAIKVHHLVPRSREVLHKRLLRVVRCIDFCECTKLGVRTEEEIDASGGPLGLARLPIAPSYTPPEMPSTVLEGSHFVFMSSRLTKKSFVSVSGRSVKTPCLVCPKFAPSARKPPTSTVISGAVSVSNCARSSRNSSADRTCPPRR